MDEAFDGFGYGSIGIIGGGPAGLIALNECSRQLQKSVTLYEQNDAIGGTWQCSKDWPGVLPTTVFNTSGIISSFDASETLYEYLQRAHHGSTHPTSAQFLSYLQEFVAKSDMTANIELSTKVLNISVVDEKNGSSHCLVEGVKLNKTTRETEATFSKKHDFLFICTARNSCIKLPTWAPKILPPEMIHASQSPPLHLLGPEKAALVVGGQSSGGEAVCHLLSTGATVYWQMSSNQAQATCWLINRLGMNGRPIDESECRLSLLIPTWIQLILLRLLVLTPLCSYRLWPLPIRTKDKFSVCDVNVVLTGLQTHQLVLLPDSVCGFKSAGQGCWKVQLRGGSEISEPVHCVVMATGYSINWSILGKDRSSWRFGFIGFDRILGSALPLMQMESRWWLYHWTRWASVSSQQQTLMQHKITADSKKLALKNISVSSPVQICEKRARSIGCTPRVWSRLFSLHRSERRLGLALLLGPWCCQQYSLDRDPNRWSSYLLRLAEDSRGRRAMKLLLSVWEAFCVFSTAMCACFVWSLVK